MSLIHGVLKNRMSSPATGLESAALTIEDMVYDESLRWVEIIRDEANRVFRYWCKLIIRDDGVAVEYYIIVHEGSLEIEKENERDTLNIVVDKIRQAIKEIKGHDFNAKKRKFATPINGPTVRFVSADEEPIIEDTEYKYFDVWVVEDED